MKKQRWIFFAVGLLVAQSALAHGDLLIRIAEVTQQINAATNKAAQLYLERAELYRMDQNWSAAEADYTRANQLTPNLLSIEICHAGMLADSGQLESARAMFTSVLKRSPKNGDAFVGRARALIKLGQRKSAIADFQRGLDLLTDPAPQISVELAETFKVEGNLDEALRTLDRGIIRLGPLPTLQSLAIDLELTRKNFDGALARIDTLLPQLLRKENWLSRRGDILVEAARRTEARQSYEEALAAIKTLPSRVQQSSPMLRLKTHVEEALGGTLDTAIAGK